MLRFFLATALLATTPSVANAAPADPPNGACKCATGPEQLLDQIGYVFIGDLIEVKGGGEGTGTAVIRVRENFKGNLSGVIDVRDALDTQCSWSVFEMAAPGRYVIFANLDEGELVTPPFCPQTQPISGWTDRLAPFRAYARAHKTASPAAPASTPAATARTAPSLKTGS